MERQQITRSESITTGASSVEVLQANPRRVALYVTVTAGAAHSINKGVAPAVAGQGIVLQLNATWFESDSEGFRCWRGPVQVISTAAGTVAVSETTEV